MPRITKTSEERREEIVKTAQNFFINKGYVETKVSDIVKSIGVSQGTFYYYFKSKKEVIDAIIDDYIKELIQKAKPILENPGLTALEKLEKMSDSQLDVNMKKNWNIHRIKGVDIHERIIAKLVTDYTPLQVKAFQQGIDEGVFQVDHVQEITEIFVVAANVLFDPGIFNWSNEERYRRLSFIISFMEQCLKASKGTFDFYKRLMSGGVIS